MQVRTALPNLIANVLFGAGHRDKRARIIHRIAMAIALSTLAFSILMGLAGFEFLDRKSFLEPFYLSWISGAALFLLSIWIAIKQLDNPAAESSQRRMEILVKGREGPAVEYFLRKFHEFEHYAEFSCQRIVFKDYRANGERVLVEKTVSMLLKNFIEDVWSNYTHTIAHDTGVDSDEFSIMYFRVNGERRGIAASNEGKQRSTTYDIRIEPDQGVLVEFGVRHWIENPQNLTQSVPRFTSKLSLDFENHTDRPVTFAWGDERIELTPGDVKPVLTLHDLPPGLAYRGELSLRA